MNIKEIKDNARALVKGWCRVCPVCDGRACAGEVPGMGGAGSGAAFKNNVSALAGLRFNVRLVHGVRDPRLDVEILGLKLSLPVIIAPIGGISFNLGGAMGELDYQMAVAEAASSDGIIAAMPDSAPKEVMENSVACVRKLGGTGMIFIKPWEFEEFDQKVGMAAEAGCKLVGCDIDSAGLITLRKMNHPAYPKRIDELSRMVECAHSRGMKFIIKGLMSVEDAQACHEAGVDGIVVSNHGGRTLDFTPGTAEVLPGIASAVKGRMALIADGGVRSGIDILKMLALGADCVMIGRPYTIAAVGGGQEGVRAFTAMYRDQLEQAMVMTGCREVQDAGPHLFFN